MGGKKRGWDSVNRCNQQKGFTIVELLIVIVVIGILSAITITAYGNIQQRARDSKRKDDISSIVKALELYKIDHGGLYPVGSGSTSINNAWATTADASWQTLVTALQPYGNIPTDPIATPGANHNGYNYEYFWGGPKNYYVYCDGNLHYVLTYKLESETNTLKAQGPCVVSPLNYSPTMTTIRKTE